MILMLAAMLAFPLGYSLNLALTAPAVPDTGTVVEVRLPEEQEDGGSLVFRWEGRTFRAPLGGDPATWPTPGEDIDLRVRQKPAEYPGGVGLPGVTVRFNKSNRPLREAAGGLL